MNKIRGTYDAVHACLSKNVTLCNRVFLVHLWTEKMLSLYSEMSRIVSYPESVETSPHFRNLCNKVNVFFPSTPCPPKYVFMFPKYAAYSTLPILVI
jgi:hypothetical protein